MKYQGLFGEKCLRRTRDPIIQEVILFVYFSHIHFYRPIDKMEIPIETLV